MPSITLSWAANPATDNIIDYEVWGANGTSVAFGSCTKLAAVNALTWTDTGLPANQPRTYYIRPVNAVGPGSPEGPLNITSGSLSSDYLQSATTPWKAAVRAKTAAALPSNTYSNGTSGVGATLTATANGALAAVDGVTLAANDRLLVDQEATGSHNGIYVVTQLGDASHPYILTRATDANVASGLVNATAKVSEGSTFADQEWQCTTNATITVGTTTLVWAKVAIPEAPQDGTAYLRQNGAWVAAGAGTPSAGWTHAGSWTWSTNVASVDITGLGSFNELIILARNISASSSTFRVIRVSVDGGSTFYSASGDYATLATTGIETAATEISGTGVATTSAADVVAQIRNNVSGQIKIGTNNVGAPILFKASTNVINAIRLAVLAGNITGGTLDVWGK